MAMGGSDALTSVSVGLVSHPEDGLGAEELMVAADRAMYQAKKLGKNQISGNPRPRPALLSRRSTTESPPESVAVADEPAAPQPRAPGNGATAPMAPTAPTEERAVAVELGPIVVAEERATRADTGDDEPDAQVVRRQIAAASRSFDPDHQIRRAMDAFLSPGAGDRETRTPDA